MPITWKNITPIDPSKGAEQEARLVENFGRTISKVGDILDPSERQEQVAEAEGIRSLQRGVKDLQEREGLESLREGKEDFSDAALQASNPFLDKEQRETLTGEAKSQLNTERDLVSRAAMRVGQGVAEESFDVDAGRLAMARELEAQGMDAAEIESRVADFDKSGILTKSFAKTKAEVTDKALRDSKAFETNEDIQAEAIRLKNQLGNKFDEAAFRSEATARMEGKLADDEYIKTQATKSAHDAVLTGLMNNVDEDTLFNTINANPDYASIDKGAVRQFIANTNQAMAVATPQERQAISEFALNAKSTTDKWALENQQLVSAAQTRLDNTNPITPGTDSAIDKLALEGSNPIRNIRAIMTERINSPGLGHFNDTVEALQNDKEISLAEEQQIVQEAWIRTNRDYIRGAGINESFGVEVKALTDEMKKRKALASKLVTVRNGVARLDLSAAQDIAQQGLKIAGQQQRRGSNIVDIPQYSGENLIPDVNRVLSEIDAFNTDLNVFERAVSEEKTERAKKVLKQSLPKNAPKSSKAAAGQGGSIFDTTGLKETGAAIKATGKAVIDEVNPYPEIKAAMDPAVQALLKKANPEALKKAKANFNKNTGR
jgi:hypothetical protein